MTKMKKAVDSYLTLMKIDGWETMSESSIRLLLPTTGIEFGKIKHTFTLPRIDQHFAAACLKYLMGLYFMFGNSVR